MVFCPNIKSGMRYAVADAYAYWSDVTDEALLELLKGMPVEYKSITSK